MTEYTPTQKIEHRRMLIAAMVSDDYTQALEEMRVFQHDTDKPCYCATGLACELSQLGEWRFSIVHETDYYHIADLPEDEQSLGMPDVVSDYYGFTPRMSHELTYLNDDCRLTLSEIGQWLSLEPQGFIADDSRTE